MIKIHIHAPINPTGVGTHAQHLLNELIKLNGTKIKLYICPTGIVKYSTKREIRDTISQFLLSQEAFEPDAIIVIDVPRKCVQWHYDNRFSKGSAITIAYTVFELEALARNASTASNDYRNDLESLSVFDEVWVPSTWCRGILRDQIGIIPLVKVVPEGITDFNTDLDFHPRDVPVFGNIGKFEKRKGHYAILDALERFDKDGTKISFVGWWHNFWDSLKLRDRLYSGRWNKIATGVGGDTYVSPAGNVSLYLPAHEAWQEDMIPTISKVDYMVYPVFSEGWGLPIGDSIGLGIPTLSTGATGSRDFYEPYNLAVNSLFKDNYLIATMGVELAYDPPFFNKQGRWEMTNGDCVHAAMQKRLDTNNPRVDYGNALRTIAAEMKRKFSWSKSAEALLKSLGASPF